LRTTFWVSETLIDGAPDPIQTSGGFPSTTVSDMDAEAVREPLDTSTLKRKEIEAQVV